MSKTQDDVEQQHRLLGNNDDDDEIKTSIEKPIKPYVGVVSGFFLGVLFALFSFLAINPSRTPGSQFEIYSPVQHLLEYKPTSLLDDLFGRTSFMANENGFPDEATDLRWRELYNGKMHSQINSDEAAKLDSTTLNVPDQPDQFLIQLDIYHQLHCLNTIRKALWLPGVERYRSDFHDFITKDGGRNFTGRNAQHIDHCLDWIRQALVCQPDVTPVTWHMKTVKEGDRPLPILPLRKNCRNMEAIDAWARDHEVVVDFGYGVENDP